MSKKFNPNGFNLFRNGKFWMVILEGEDEVKAVKRIKEYVSVNNFDLSEFQYNQFKEHTPFSERKIIT